MIVLARLRCLLLRWSICVPPLAGFILLGGVARGDVDVWSSIGPTGGNVFVLAIDPHAPATIYAGTGGGVTRFNSTGGGGVFKTTTGGAIWAAAGSGLPGDAILSLAIDPVTSSTVYAGTRNHGVWRSTDGGTSWTATGLTTNRVFALVVDPKSPATLYAGTGSGVFKSTDGAASWTAAMSGIGALATFALAIDPATPSDLYAGTMNNGIFKSVDGAATWTAASSGLTETRVFAIAVDPRTPSTLYAGTNGSGVFKSTDGAATWKAAAFVGTSLALAIDPVTPTTVYACANSVQVANSLDGFTTLNGVIGGIPLQVINALAVDPVTPSKVYIGAANGVFKSTNAGVNATAANTGFSALKILALAVDPEAPATIYAGADAGLFKSVNAGVSWTSVAVSPYTVRVFSLLILPESSAILAGMDDGGWRSTDGGATWTRLDTLTLLPYAWAVDPGSPTTVYAAGGAGASGPTYGASMKSTDAGSTWTLYGTDIVPIFESVVVPAPGANALVGSDSGIYGIFVRPSGRLEWVTNGALASKIVWALAVDPASTSTIWAGTDSGLFRSMDSGGSFTQVISGMTATNIYVLKFDPASPSTVYAGTDGGLFRSTDRGATWNPLNAGLTNLVVNAFAIAPGSPHTLYAGIFGGSVYRFPTALPVADFTWVGIPVAGQPFGFTDLSTGPTSWSWTFGDGGVSTVPYPTHTFAAAGSYPVSLTVTNAAGPNTKTQTVTVAPAIAGSTVTKVVPIVLDLSGVGGAHFSTELTLANRGTTTATLQITYFAATSLGASGSGTVMETLAPGRQVAFPDAIAYLRGKGLTIPTGSNQGGALFVTFEGLSSADVSFAGARTTAPSGSGRAGLAYPGVRIDEGFTAKAYVFGLRENAADRSNLALVNMNAAAPVTLRVTLVSGTDGKTLTLPDITLAGGQWTQIGHVLSGPGFTNGFAIVELVSGPGPFYPYGVFNDNTTEDGSFVPPTPGSGDGRSILPVLVETSAFQSELVLANPHAQPLVATMTYVESLTPSGGAGGVATETLGPYEQKIISGAVDYLRGKGISIGALGAGSYAGTLRSTFAIGSGSIVFGFVGARTSAPANGGGQYGLFYRALLIGENVQTEAWVFGLQQNGTNRSNLAVVNYGNGTAITFRLDVYDGDTGKLAGSSPVQNLPAGGWLQFSPVLASFGVRNGYVRVVRVSGNSLMLAYGVVNDGATPGSGATNDGSYVVFSNR